MHLPTEAPPLFVPIVTSIAAVALRSEIWLSPKFQNNGGKVIHYDQVESGFRIQKLRKQHGLTQEQLAEQVHITSNNLGRLERGTQGVSVDLLIELAVYFGVTLDYIVLGRESQIDTVKAMLRTMANSLIEIEQKL